MDSNLSSSTRWSTESAVYQIPQWTVNGAFVKFDEWMMCRIWSRQFPEIKDAYLPREVSIKIHFSWEDQQIFVGSRPIMFRCNSNSFKGSIQFLNCFFISDDRIIRNDDRWGLSLYIFTEDRIQLFPEILSVLILVLTQRPKLKTCNGRTSRQSIWVAELLKLSWLGKQLYPQTSAS